jgi:hypothetical protein
MMPRRSPDLVYVPRIWPVYVSSTVTAVFFWLLAVLTGHPSVLLPLAGIAFCAGLVVFIVFLLLKYRVFVIVPESWELPLFRLGIGLCWGGFTLFLFAGLTPNQSLQPTAGRSDV